MGRRTADVHLRRPRRKPVRRGRGARQPPLTAGRSSGRVPPFLGPHPGVSHPSQVIRAAGPSCTLHAGMSLHEELSMVDRLNGRRGSLPVPDRQHLGLITYDAKDPDPAFPPIEPLLPPEGAPNVLIVLLDDVGFGASSAFGGPCRTPTAERLAAGGLRYNRFHTTALCAPTRQALLTGRNHHSVGMGSITETATSAPGNSSLRPNTK